MKRQIPFTRYVALVLLLTFATVPMTGHAASLAASGQIVFASYRDGNYEIYVMNADGSNQTRLTNNAAADSNPDWSPDGTRIAFESTRDSNLEVYVMDADGTIQSNLSQNSARDFDPAWSPDGTRIAFTSDREGNYEIYLMNTDGSSLTNLSNNPAIDIYPAWQPLPRTPRQAIERLIGEVNAIDLNPGQGNALTAKLEAAIQQLDKDNIAPAINQLQAFLNQVNALMSSGLLSSAEGQLLLDAANAIIGVLGG